MRSLVIEGWNLEALALGFLFTFLLIGGALAASAASLKTRMART
jgi:hypothetical protein